MIGLLSLLLVWVGGRVLGWETMLWGVCLLVFWLYYRGNPW